MKAIKGTGRIEQKERLNNSVNGNPRYFVEIYQGEGHSISGNTASDKPLGYGNWREDDGVTFEAHETRTGAIVFDKIKEQD